MAPWMEMDSHKDDLETQVFPLRGARSHKAGGKSKAKTACAIALAFLVLAAGLCAFLTWLAVLPVRAPTYSIDNVQVNSFALTDATLGTSLAFHVTATNRNHKLGFRYDWIRIDASYDGLNFGRGSVARFNQKTRTSTIRTAEINVWNVALPVATVASMEADIRNGSVPLRAYATAQIRKTWGKLVLLPMSVDVDCQLVVAPATSTSGPRVVSQVCKLIRRKYKKAGKYGP